MKIIFAGTPEFAAAHLQALIDAKHNIIAVYTQPDRPAGRGKKLQASAVKCLALEHSIPVEQPANFKQADSLSTLHHYNCDLMVVVAYGLLLPQSVLDTPKRSCINVHGSLLPRWRGAAPIQRAIWAGDEKTGVCIMQMDIGLDTGPVLLQKELLIESDDTSASLYIKLAQLGPKALLEYLDNIDTITPIAQDDAHASYASKLSKAEAKCDWSLSCEQLARNVRAFNPWPIAWFMHNDTAIKIFSAEAVLQEHSYPYGSVVDYDRTALSIACKDGLLMINKLQLPGKKPQTIEQVANGKPELFQVGDVLNESSAAPHDQR